MGVDPGDAFAARERGFEEQFAGLPEAGTAAYWWRIEQVPEQASEEGQAVPLEVLARCLRERWAHGAREDAARVYSAIQGRIDAELVLWARRVAGMARGARGLRVEEDLVQQCALALWRELTEEGDTFLLVHFAHALGRLQQHVAHGLMQQWGLWRRKGVASSTRVPWGQLESVEADRRTDEGVPLAHTLPDPHGQDAFDRVGAYDDLAEALRALSPEERRPLYAAFWEGRTQQEIADLLGVTDRTVRNRLERVYDRLRATLVDER